MAIELFTNISLETTPIDPKHLVPMSWVEEFVAGRVKMPVRVVAVANLAGTYAPAPAMPHQHVIQIRHQRRAFAAGRHVALTEI